MADTSKLIIREGKKEDCVQIRGLIQELADYEKTPDGPKITADTLIQDGFGDRQFFHTFVAELDNKLVGFTLFFYAYSTWEGKAVYMEDIYVQPDFRSKGIGTKLWKRVVASGLKEGCTRCNFQVLDWNKPSIDYYKRQGAKDISESEGWLSFRMTHDAMKAFVKKEETK
jgi:diamine N-acetyltransferase